MDVRLRLPGDLDGGELRQLYAWLTRDQELRLGADMALCAEDGPPGKEAAVPAPGTTMGGAFDVIQLVLDAGLELASLGFAVFAWREAQRSRSPVEVERHGVRVVLPPDLPPEQLAAILDRLAAPEPGPGTGAGAGPGPEPGSDTDGPEDAAGGPEGGRR